MAWFLYDQNYTGASFIEPAFAVIIEARNPKEANRRAEEVGIYFNGVEKGIDCECCGDRWSDYWDDEYDKALDENKLKNFLEKLKKIPEGTYNYNIEKSLAVYDLNERWTLYELNNPYDVYSLRK